MNTVRPRTALKLRKTASTRLRSAKSAPRAAPSGWSTPFTRTRRSAPDVRARHATGRSDAAVVEAHLRLRSADRIGERTAARYDDGAAGAARNRGDPLPQVGREREAAAQLDDGRSRAMHLVGGPRGAPRGRKEMMHLRHLGAPLAHDFHSGADVELFDPYGDARDPRISQDQRSNPFGQRFYERDMFLRGHHPDRILDEVI